MLRYFRKRLFLLIPVLLGVSLLVFVIVHLAPGDPALTLLGPNATQEELVELRTQLGLDKPLVLQYGLFLKNILKGNLGKSLLSGEPVLSELKQRTPITLRLAIWGTLFSILIGIPLGTLAALYQNTWIDNLCSFFALAGFSFPNFWLALMLMLMFSIYFPVLPSSGMGTWKHLILPVIVIGIQNMAIIARMTRSSMLEIIRQDYIRTAHAKGMPSRIILFRHIFSNALIPVITVIGLNFGNSLGGLVITETVFSIPGTGRLLVDAIRANDYPVVQGGVMFFALFVGLVNLSVDFIYAIVDPRIKSMYR